MGAIRSGGIASGLDVNGIIESLVTAAKEPITALDNRSHLLSLQKTLFKETSDDFNSLKNVLFNLKLESTFKSKNTSLSNPVVASVSASPSAKAGTYTIDVVQKATQASHTSYLCRAAVTSTGAGLVTSGQAMTDLAGKYIQQEADVTTTVDVVTATGTWVAMSEFKPLSSSTSYQKQYFTNDIDSTNTLFSDIYGGINSNHISAGTTMNFNFSHSGGNATFNLNVLECFVNAAGEQDADGSKNVFKNIKDINQIPHKSISC